MWLMEKNSEELDIEKEKAVRIYFQRIFTRLPKEIREQFGELTLSKKDKTELIQEIAFLSKGKQKKYIKELLRQFEKKN